jgi:peptide/nickel transport system permease protein
MAGGPAVGSVVGVRAPRAGAVASFRRRYPVGAAGAAVILAMALVAVLAPLVVPYDPLVPDYGAMLARPGPAHWLGTDAFGRDVFSRIVWGARTALTVGLAAALVGATLGAVVGVAGAYFGGLADLLVERVVDVLLSFPLIILALAVVASLGNGIGTVILAITVPMIPRCARVIRSSALAIRRTPYVDAARAAGYGHARIILRHMLPNVMAPYLIMVTAFMGQAILLAETAPWLALFPGLAISLAVLAFNLFGDSLRDALDPKLRTP